MCHQRNDLRTSMEAEPIEAIAVVPAAVNFENDPQEHPEIEKGARQLGAPFAPPPW
jgi:hypothetical protein